MKLPGNICRRPGGHNANFNDHRSETCWNIGCIRERSTHFSLEKANMSDIGNITAAATTSAPTSSDPVKDAARRPVGGELGQEQFMRLLVAQLENQNPLEPLDNAAFISQLATFSSLEKLSSIESILKSVLEKAASSQANSNGVPVSSDAGEK
jgi:hypothetical protein